MARGVQGGGCVIVHVGSRRLIPKQETPKDDLGGKRKAVFVAVCRVKTVGLIVQGTPTDDAWSFGLRRRNDPLPANGGLEEDQDAS